MNRFLFILLATFTATALAERPAAFLGIQWGASPEEARRAMQERPGVKFSEESDDYRIELTGGTFAGQPVAKWVLEFPERKFGMASVILKTEGNAEALYKDFRSQLASKYGSSTSSKKLSTASSSRNNGGMRQQSYGNISTWRFLPNLKDRSVVVISAELTGPGGGPTNNPDQLMLTIRYENETLTSAAEKNMAAGETATKTRVLKEDL